jgi:hypothetical protein
MLLTKNDKEYRMKRVVFCLLCIGLAGAFSVSGVFASILGFQQLTIDLTKPKLANKQLRWSPGKYVKLTARGLGRKGHPATSRDGWIRTAPLAVGTSWRPTRSVSLRVQMTPGPSAIKLANGKSYTPYRGSVFARYSPDRRSWSSWQVLQQPNLKWPNSFRGSLLVPRIESKHYDGLLSVYMRRNDVPWKSDEEALVREIIKRKPRYFEKYKPFIGYVQVMWEGSFRGSRYLTKLDVRATFAVSGRHYAAKDPKVSKNRSGTWRFVHPLATRKHIP